MSNCRWSKPRGGALKNVGLSERAAFVQAAPGRLPFADASFDMVFSKDALLHVPDKDALFAEIFRVLKPGGVFAASNWMISHDGEPSPDMKAYIAAEGLSFSMASPQRYAEAMRRAGFQDIAVRDRNPWYRDVARGELEALKGPLYLEVADVVGSAYVDKNIATWEAMQKVLDSGEHRPTHLRGWKPAVLMHMIPSLAISNTWPSPALRYRFGQGGSRNLLCLGDSRLSRHLTVLSRT